MAYAPCKNPNCNSYGQPHPNCRCYNEMASGGVVTDYCSRSEPHKPGCMYFAEGGSVSAGDSLNAIIGHTSDAGVTALIRMFDNIDKYRHSVKRGHKKIDDNLDKVFSGQRIPAEDRSKHHKKIHDWVEKGGILNDLNEENYRNHDPDAVSNPEVSNVHGHAIENVFPEHNVEMQNVKARVASYLGNLRPKEHEQRMAFDADPDQSEKKRSYERAIKIADAPMSVLHEISKHTLSPEHINHLQNMYPELHGHLQKKVTEKIIKSQLDKKKPSYKIRDQLSLIMGVPLSSEMKPQNIQAAQAVYAPKKMPMQQQGQAEKPKKNTNSLSKSDAAFLTSDQAIIKRQQKTS